MDSDHHGIITTLLVKNLIAKTSTNFIWFQHPIRRQVFSDTSLVQLVMLVSLHPWSFQAPSQDPVTSMEIMELEATINH